jgi:BlaI family penicillinase repressor
MARPRVKELTERELEVMHSFWKLGELTVADARDDLLDTGRELAYTTVATLVRILCEKGFLQQTSDDRPYRFKPVRTFEDVSRSMLGDLLDRVFGGSREQLMMRLVEQNRMTPRERRAIEQILRESGQ